MPERDVENRAAVSGWPSCSKPLELITFMILDQPHPTSSRSVRRAYNMGSTVRSKKMALSEPSGRLPAAMAATQGSHLSQCGRPWLATSPHKQSEVTRVADVMRALISDSIFKQPIQLRTVIPGRAKREPD
jgi:hypothetical protein